MCVCVFVCLCVLAIYAAPVSLRHLHGVVSYISYILGHVLQLSIGGCCFALYFSFSFFIINFFFGSKLFAGVNAANY